MTPDHSGSTPALDLDDTSPVSGDAPDPRRRRWLRYVILAAVVLVAVVVLARSGKKGPGSGPAAAGRSAGPIPVVVAAAKSQDVPVYLTGLGTVTPLNTVTVRSRVDGQLLRLAFREGQLVREGELLAELDPRPFQVQLTQAQGQLAKDQAALVNARQELTRFQALFKDDLIPKSQLDSQEALAAQGEAAIQSDQGAVEAAKLNITYTKITAPISGRTGLRLVDPGNVIHASDANGIVVLTQTEPIAVIFTIPQDELPEVARKVRAGEKLPAEARDRDLSRVLASGELVTLDNQIDPTTGTVRLKAVFPNRDAALFPNQFVNVRFQIETVPRAIVVPAAAVQRGTQATFVYVVRPDETVAMRPIELRLVEGETAVIAKGLTAGESVVIDGMDKLQEGSKIAPRPAGGEPAPKSKA